MTKIYGNQREAVLVGYLAGIIDGEGSISLKKVKPNAKRKTKNPTYEGAITLGMVEKRIIELFVERYGGTYRIERVPNRQPIYRYAKVGTKGVLPILEELAPYLIEKRERAEVLMEYYKSINTERNRVNGKVVQMTDEELSLREDFYQKMKELNAKKAPATTNREDTRESEVIV
jgi:hypothetical protein